MNTRLGFALGLPFLALALQWYLWPWLQPFAWFLFYPAVFFSARLAGLIGGILSTLISILLACYFFIPPQLSWDVVTPSNLYSVGGFLLMGVLISSMHERLLRAQASAEDRLGAVEDRFEAVFDQAAVGIAILTPEGHWLRVNQKICDIVGYTQEELIATTFQQITHPDDLEADVVLVRHVLDGALDTYTLEKRYIHKKGHSVWINLSVSLARTADGQPDYFISVVEEIGLRKQAEAELSKFKAIIESSRDAIISESLTGLITSWNAGAEQVFGYRAAEILGRSIELLIPPERRHEESGIIDRISRSEKIEHFETVRIHKTGRLIHLSLTISPILDETGKTIGASKIARDITARKHAEEQIGAGLAKLEAALEAMTDAVYIVDLGGRLIHFNDAFVSFHKFRDRRDCPQAASDYALMLDVHTLGGEFLSFEQWAVSRALRGEVGKNVEFLVQRSDSGERWVGSYNFSPIFDEGGAVIGAVVSSRDVTDRKATEDELRIAAITFDSNDCMMVTDAHGTVLKVNPNFTRVTGYTAQEVLGKPSGVLKSGRDNVRFYDLMWKSIRETGSWEGEIWDKRKNGEIFPAHLNISSVKNAAGDITNYVATFNDATAAQSAADEIKHLAFFDPLTGLPNRRLLLDRLQQALAAGLRSGREGGLLFIDLDDFKSLNDTLGHDVGDLLLQQVALRLVACVREGDTVARFGGDEFVVVLENLSAQALEAAAQTEAIGEKILSSVSQPFQLASHVVRTTPSIGATLFADHYGNIDELLKQADVAMYQAKKAGRNRLRFFDPEMQETISNRAILEAELHAAIDKQQFQLYYQLQVDRAGEPVGAECLLRWNHPTRGVLLPDVFLPQADETGLTLPIGKWAIEVACAQLTNWQQQPALRHLVLSMNVSANQLRDPDFVAQLQSAIHRHELVPDRLRLELTEAMLFEDIECIGATMAVLRELGVLFALDDFGSGFSSLPHLRRLPLDQIKIDACFVQAIADSADARAVVGAIVALAQSLNLAVVGEGVESGQQEQFLHELGCRAYQGYLYGRALPLDEFIDSLARVRVPVRFAS